MNAQILTLNQPITVVQAFHHWYQYHKDQRRFEERKQQAQWQRQFPARGGYVEDGKLYVPHEVADLEALRHATHMVLNVCPPSYRLPPNQCLNLSKGLADYSDFKLKLLEGGVLEIHLNWSFDGYFNPQQYKIAELATDMVLEIKRNQKADFTLTGRKERTYTEAYTMMRLLGNFSEVHLIPSGYTPPTIQLPVPTKTVDLMKRLY